MPKVIITGHNGYATAVKNHLAMVVGKVDGYTYVDFNPEDDIESLDAKLKEALNQWGDEEVLFACDIVGGSPFKQSATLCLENLEKRMTVAGLSALAYMEMAFNLTLPLSELADLAVDTTKNGVMRFPENSK